MSRNIHKILQKVSRSVLRNKKLKKVYSVNKERSKINIYEREGIINLSKKIKSKFLY